MPFSRISVLSLITVFALGVVGCASDEYGNRRPMTRTETGALIGAASGAIVGGLASKNNRSKHMLFGAVGGGLTGAAVGSYMDNQKRDFEKQLASEVAAGAIQVEKDAQHNLRVTMTAQTAFDFNASDIKPGFEPSLDKISEILNRYGKTHLTIVGHTDNVGSDAYNQRLSEQRALAVQNYFSNKNVIPQRLEAVSRGEQQPRATNATEDGRRLNRRVEILIEPLVVEGNA